MASKRCSSRLRSFFNSSCRYSKLYSKRGVGGADPVYGHVGFVERVNADGSLFISEMNVQGVNVISTRTIPAGVAAQATYINFGL